MFHFLHEFCNRIFKYFVCHSDFFNYDVCVICTFWHPYVLGLKSYKQIDTIFENPVAILDTFLILQIWQRIQIQQFHKPTIASACFSNCVTDKVKQVKAIRLSCIISKSNENRKLFVSLRTLPNTKCYIWWWILNKCNNFQQFLCKFLLYITCVYFIIDSII